MGDAAAPLDSKQPAIMKNREKLERFPGRSA
jgi:hypothetical protein